MGAIAGLTVCIQEISLATLVRGSASCCRITPLTPRSKLTGVLARPSVAVLLILSDLADATTVSRGLDDIAMTSLEVEATVLNSTNKTTRCRSPFGPSRQNTGNRARDSVTRHRLGQAG